MRFMNGLLENGYKQPVLDTARLDVIEFGFGSAACMAASNCFSTKLLGPSFCCLAQVPGGGCGLEFCFIESVFEKRFKHAPGRVASLSENLHVGGSREPHSYIVFAPSVWTATQYRRFRLAGPFAFGAEVE